MFSKCPSAILPKLIQTLWPAQATAAILIPKLIQTLWIYTPRIKIPAALAAARAADLS